MSGWRTIDTAPKDGKDVLVFDPKLMNGVVVAGWIRDSIIHGRPCWMAYGGAALEPTHWMPLPEPPDA